MITDILTAAGIPHEQGVFPEMPDGTCAVYFDHVALDGADPVEEVPLSGLPRIEQHDAEIELYETLPDPEKEAALEAELTGRGLLYDKQDRYWLANAQRFQVLYGFSFTVKKGG